MESNFNNILQFSENGPVYREMVNKYIEGPEWQTLAAHCNKKGQKAHAI